MPYKESFGQSQIGLFMVIRQTLKIIFSKEEIVIIRVIGLDYNLNSYNNNGLVNFIPINHFNPMILKEPFGSSIISIQHSYLADSSDWVTLIRILRLIWLYSPYGIFKSGTRQYALFTHKKGKLIRIVFSLSKLNVVSKNLDYQKTDHFSI